MTARDAILARIRNANGGDRADDGARRAAVAQRLAEAPKGVVPARGQLPDEERIRLFVTMAEAVHSSTARVASRDDVPGEIARYLRERNLPAAVRMGADPRLAAMPWNGQALTVSHGASNGRDEIGVSHAFAGVAETGTLALTSGGDNPTSLNFLPEHHLVVVDAADVAGDLESVWARLRAARGKGDMPRTVNLVTGPSRSGDIEQTLLLGAHGPRALHIIVVG
ncbi:MAG TPA: lactate utilization protein [Rhizobiaceae bacterium]|nr:lactate utilization protein [Rhizobiaceae bacterium]